jgi:hypothetical protein
MVVKRSFRYLVHTPNLGLWYSKGSTFDLLSYFDSDYAGCKVDRKSEDHVWFEDRWMVASLCDE